LDLLLRNIVNVGVRRDNGSHTGGHGRTAFYG
jgi:hypothetical protein